jgi:hypothetical protein
MKDKQNSKLANWKAKGNKGTQDRTERNEKEKNG